MLHSPVSLIGMSPNEYVWPSHIYILQSMDQQGEVANPARGQLNRENEYFIFPCLSPFASENLVSRDAFGRPVPRQPAHSPNSG